MERMDAILPDMDLALEGVPVSEQNRNVIVGLAILEHNMPTFNYSKEGLTLSEKVLEIRNFYIRNGYASNEEILNVIDNVTRRKIA